MNIATLIVIILVLIVLAWLVIRLLSRAYIKTTPGTAFVRTGGFRGAAARPAVVMNGAAWVFSFLHRLKWVSLETMALEVRHIEGHALITNDPQYVDLESRFFIKVGNNPESIAIAARTIGGDVVDESTVRRLVEPKINGAVRDIAAAFSLRELLEQRTAFIRRVQERLRDDLAENGLALESVSILTLRPTLQGHFSTDDILGAQVARANAAVIEEALTAKNRLENQGALERARQDSEAERERMAIEEQIEKERAERAKNIALVQATESTAAKVVQEARREEAERARILADRALQETMIENERVASLLREQTQKALELERVLREQAVTLAGEERDKLVAEASAAKLAATRLQIEADREREEAVQKAMTVIEKAAAEREAELELIRARMDAERQTVERKTEVELDALRLREMAEAEQDVAARRAEISRIQAEAELDAAKKAALGERERSSAAGLAEVQVALERIKVLDKESEAIRRKLIAEAEGEMAKAEALASHDRVGQEMELARLNTEALKAIEIAKAQALGEAISSMKMNLFGDAAMAHRLLQLVTAAQSSQAVYEALPSAAKNTLEGLAARFSGANGNHNIPALLDDLLRVLRTHYPDVFDDNPTLGELANRIFNGPDGDTYRHLSPLFDHPRLRDLPLQTALALAQEWFGWKGPG